MEKTEFWRVPDMEGYYISSNAPSNGEFVPIEEYDIVKAKLQIAEELIDFEMYAEFEDRCKQAGL